MATMKVERIGYALGAKVTGIDLSQPLAAEALADIRQAWLEHLVLWDNRCLTHLAVGDYDPKAYRHMIRTSTIGDYIGRYEDPDVKVGAAPLASSEVAAGVSARHD